MFLSAEMKSSMLNAVLAQEPAKNTTTNDRFAFAPRGPGCRPGEEIT